MVVIAVRGDQELISRARSGLDGFYENKENADYYDLMDFLLEILGTAGYNPSDVIGYLFEYNSPDKYERSPGYRSRSPNSYKSPGTGGFYSSPKKPGRGRSSSKKKPRKRDDPDGAVQEESIGDELEASAKKSQEDVYGNNRSPNTQRLIEDTQGSTFAKNLILSTIFPSLVFLVHNCFEFF